MKVKEKKRLDMKKVEEKLVETKQHRILQRHERIPEAGWLVLT